MSIFKSTLKPYIRRQINARQSLLASEERPSYMTRWVSAKAPWFKMSSFVDYNNSDALAKKYVLFGGTAYSGPEIDQNQLALRSGINVKRGAYGDLGDRSAYGVRPMPGIESVDIKSKSAYGSLREAVVTFYAWDKKQLEDLERLYMRPGYYVLLEWGWSMYLDSNNGYGIKYENFRTRYPSNNSSDQVDINKNILKNFDDPTINPFEANLSEEKIYEILDLYRFRHSGNYDGMMGVVRNFSWEFMPNGGYICKSTIISIGDVIDTLKMSSVTSQKTDVSEKEGTANPTTFELILDDFNSDQQTSVKKTYEDAVVKSNIVGIHTDIVRPSQKVAIAGGQDRAGYIQFAYFIFILQQQINLFDDKGSPLLNIEVPVYNPENTGNGLCIASEDSVSVDLYKCFVNNSKATFITGDKLKGFNMPVENTTTPCKEYLNANTNLGVIGNIYYNLQYIKAKYKEILSSKGSVYVGEFIRSLLDDANLCLGNVNAFDIFVIDRTIAIIDKQYTEIATETASGTKFVINLSGNNTAVRNSKIESKIFPSQASMIAIAAQDRENVSAVNSSTNAAFNKGLTNRIKKMNVEISNLGQGYQTSEADKKAQEEQEKTKLIENVLTLRRYIKGMIENNIRNGYQDQVSSMSSVLNSIILKINGDANYRAIIPISLEIELDGLAGFTIGEIFRVNQDILPTSYNDRNLGFIITGIQNRIARSEWSTIISTQICLLDQEKLTNKVISVNKNEVADEIGKYVVEKITINEMSLIAHNMLVAYIADFLGGATKGSTIQANPRTTVSLFLNGFYTKQSSGLFTFDNPVITTNSDPNNATEYILRLSVDSADRKEKLRVFRNAMFNNLAKLAADKMGSQTYQFFDKTIAEKKQNNLFAVFFPEVVYEEIATYYQYGTENISYFIKRDRPKGGGLEKTLELLDYQIKNSEAYNAMQTEVKKAFDEQYSRLLSTLRNNRNNLFVFKLLAYGTTNINSTTGDMNAIKLPYDQGIKVGIGQKASVTKVYTKKEKEELDKKKIEQKKILIDTPKYPTF